MNNNDKLPPIFPGDNYLLPTEWFCSFDKNTKDCWDEYVKCMTKSSVVGNKRGNSECCRKKFVWCMHEKKGCCPTDDHDNKN